MPYLPIENYGVIGDMRTVSLVGNNGSVDWFCYPAFDSPSNFAANLDDQKGGRFQISPTCKVKTYNQFYWPETNVLVTRFLAADAVGEVVDFMPIGRRADNTPFHRLVRQVRKRLDQGRLIFEQMLGHANHLGLYAEETGPAGEALGNFPQAFRHLSLISAAYNLDRALGRRS